MNLEHLVSHYGYAAVFVGTLLEGETILVLGGYFAQRGYLDLHWVILLAFSGTYACDQFLFHLGRWKGARLLEKHPRWKRKSAAVLDRLRKHRIPVVLGFRFVYGFRTVTPLAVGMSGVDPVLFLVLNGISAAAWATGIGLLGYVFGKAVESMVGKVERYEVVVILVIAGIGAIVWAVRLRRRGRLENMEGADHESEC